MKSEPETFWAKNRLLFVAIIMLTFFGLVKTLANQDVQGKLVAYKNVNGIIRLFYQ